MRLRRIVSDHTYRAYAPVKEQLMEQRLVHFRAGRRREYAELIGRASQVYQLFLKATARLAAEHLDSDENSFDLSVQEARKNQAVACKLQLDEELARLRVEKPREVLHSRDEIKAIVMEQTKMEGECEAKLAQVHVRTE